MSARNSWKLNPENASIYMPRRAIRSVRREIRRDNAHALKSKGKR